MSLDRQRCGQCRYWTPHHGERCEVCASHATVRLVTDADVEARFRARRAAHKAKMAVKRAATPARDEMYVCNDFSKDPTHV